MATPPVAIKPPMTYRNLGRTGLKVSVLSFGSWVSFGYQIGVPEAKKMIQTCLHYGVNFFDNAEVYALGESERIFGKALKELNIPRCDIVISTKVYFGATKDPSPTAKGLSRKHIIEGLRASLQRLELDYVDIVFAHRPDPETPIEETVRAMNWVIDQGYAFYWGTSEWSAEQIEEAWSIANRLRLIGPAAEQPQYNLFNNHRIDNEYAPLYDKYGLGLTTWSPLASGLLTGKYSGMGDDNNGNNTIQGTRFELERYAFLADRWLQADKIKAVDALIPIANEYDCTVAQLALAWCASNPRVSTVLTGASKEGQIHENMQALNVISKLNEKERTRIESVLKTAAGV